MRLTKKRMNKNKTKNKCNKTKCNQTKTKSKTKCKKTYNYNKRYSRKMTGGNVYKTRNFQLVLLFNKIAHFYNKKYSQFGKKKMKYIFRDDDILWSVYFSGNISLPDILSQVINVYKEIKGTQNKQFLKYNPNDFNDLIILLKQEYNKQKTSSFKDSLVKEGYNKDYIHETIGGVAGSTAGIGLNNYCMGLGRNDDVILNVEDLQFKKLLTHAPTSITPTSSITPTLNAPTPNVPTSITPTSSITPTPNVPTPNVPTPNVPTPNAPTSSNVPTPNVPTPNVPTPNAPTSSITPTSSNVPTQIVPTPNVPTPNVPTSIVPTPVIGGSYDNPIPIKTTANVFLDKEKTLWLQEKITKDYTVTDVDRDGNCFFATLREAFKTIGVTMTVDDLRQIVYNNFEEWKKKHPEEVKDQLALQEDIKLELEKLEKIDDADETTKKHYFYGEVLPSIKRWCAESSSKNLQYCKDFNNRYKVGDINDKSLEDANGKDVKISYFKYNFVEQNKNPSLKDEKEIKVKTDFVDKFYNIATNKRYRDQRKKELEAQDRDNKFLIPLKADDIMLRNHWAGQMDIDILKDKLNIDLIIISKDYNNDDIRFTCDINVVDPNVKPGYYIMIYYTGGHYELISFKERSVFKYDDIPADIIRKCILK